MPLYPRVRPAREPPVAARHGGNAAPLAQPSNSLRCQTFSEAEARLPAPARSLTPPRPALSYLLST